MSRLCIVSFQGVYLGAFMLVCADDSDHAILLAIEHAAKEGMHPAVESFGAVPVEWDDTGTMMIWNGDY